MKLGIYFNSDGNPGGGSAAMTPEELTNAKLAGEELPPAGKNGTPDGAEEPPLSIETGEGESGSGKPAGEEPPAEPKKEKEKPPAGAEPKKKKSSEPPADGDSGHWYDPEQHVEGKPAHTNKFKTRESGEYAAIQKAELMRDTLAKLEKDGVNRGAIPLPKALNDSLDNLDQFTSLEQIVEMDDDDLRTFLNESDQFRQRLENKHSRRKDEMKARQHQDNFEKLQVETFDNLKQVMSVDEVQNNLDKFADLEKGTEFTKAKINEKVKSELATERQELEDWIDQVDAGEIDMTIKEFDAEKQKRVKSIVDKEREIRGKYEPVLDQLSELYELSQNVDQTKELSPEQKSKNMWDAFSEFQEDRRDDLDMLADNPAARAELVSFKNWVVQNAADFNDLQHPGDYNQAVKKWEDFKKQVRAGRQKKELSGQGKNKNKSGGGDNEDIPKPGDQDKLKGDRKQSVADVRRRSLDKLVELTNATVGA